MNTKEFVKLTDQDLESWYKHQKAYDIKFQFSKNTFGTIEKNIKDELCFRLMENGKTIFGSTDVVNTINKHLSEDGRMQYHGMWVDLFQKVHHWCITNRLRDKLDII
jgi:hypothetical protein